jgi:hypothetical protein
LLWLFRDVPKTLWLFFRNVYFEVRRYSKYLTSPNYILCFCPAGHGYVFSFTHNTQWGWFFAPSGRRTVPFVYSKRKDLLESFSQRFGIHLHIPNVVNIHRILYC